MNWGGCDARARDELGALPPAFRNSRGWFLAGWFAALDAFQETTPCRMKSDAVRERGLLAFGSFATCGTACADYDALDFFRAGWGRFAIWVFSFNACFRELERD